MKREIRLTGVLLTGLFLAAVLMTPASIYAQNYALEFDGIEEYVQLSQPLEIGSSSNTIELWVKIPKVGSGNLDSGERVGIILGNFDNDPNAGWEIHSNGQMRLWWNNGQIDVYGSADLRDNKWHHLAFVRDKVNDKFIFYIDGEVELEVAGAGADITFTTTHRIGADNRGSGTPYFHGQMDELRIWSKARTQTEIQDNMYSELDGTEVGLVACFNMNEGSGTTLTDQSLNDNQGTLVNMDDSNWVTHPFSGGEGDETNPYQIDNLDDLRFLSENSFYWDKHFIQTADIDARKTSSWNENGNGGYYGFSPIGTSTYDYEALTYVDDPFTGSFDGQGHTITGLFIDRGDTDNVGLFGYTNGSAIRNVGLVDVDVTGHSRVGGLVGMNGDPGGSIDNSYSTGSVTGEDLVGGLVGMNYGGIHISYSTVDVTGVSYWVGGLVGRNISNGTISNSYATGEVSGGERVGGLVGQNEANIDHSYATGLVTGTDLVGGLAWGPDGNVSNSFWDTETSKQTTSDGGTGKTTAEMKEINTFSAADWDIAYANGKSDPVWQILDPANGSISYPFFFAFHYDSFPGEEMIDYAVGITANPTEGGEVTGEGTYNYEDNVEVTATPNTGWAFVNWTDNDDADAEVSTVATHTFSMPAGDVNYTANFEQKEYHPENFATALDGGTLETDKDVYHYGDIAVITAVPDEGYGFIAWTGHFIESGIRKSSSSENNPIEIMVDDATDIQAVFDAAPIPLGNRALYLGFILMVVFVVIRFRGSIFY